LTSGSLWKAGCAETCTSGLEGEGFGNRAVATPPRRRPSTLLRKLPSSAAEELLEIVMRRYERASTLMTSNRPVEDWGKLLGDSAAVTAMLDRLLHHGHVLKCGPRSWRTKMDLPDQEAKG